MSLGETTKTCSLKNSVGKMSTPQHTERLRNQKFSASQLTLLQLLIVCIVSGCNLSLPPQQKAPALHQVLPDCWLCEATLLFCLLKGRQLLYILLLGWLLPSLRQVLLQMNVLLLCRNPGTVTNNLEHSNGVRVLYKILS